MTEERTVRPRIALTLGDPAGIGPELVARQLADPETAQRAAVILVGDEQELADAMADAGVTFAWSRDPDDGLPTLIDNEGERPAEGFVRREASAAGGLWAMASLRRALELSKTGAVDAIVFAPLNKSSLHLAGMTEPDEMTWFESVLDDGTRATELNILPELGDRAGDLALLHRRGREPDHRRRDHRARRTARRRAPGPRHRPPPDRRLRPQPARRGVRPLRPPRARPDRARGLGTPCGVDWKLPGPYPSDTIFLRARDGAFDGVLTMYHDQGQIAVKLLGFDRGVTMAGGLSVPICTPAHGTAFDLVGTRSANPGAYRHAFDTA